MLDDQPVIAPLDDTRLEQNANLRMSVSDDRRSIGFDVPNLQVKPSTSISGHDGDILLVFSARALTDHATHAADPDENDKRAVKRTKDIWVVPQALEADAVALADTEVLLRIRIPYDLLRQVAFSFERHYHPSLIETAVCSNDEGLADLAKSLIDYIQRTPQPSPVRLEVYARALAGLVVTRYLKPAPRERRAEGGLSRRALRRVTLMLDTRFDEDLTLNQIAIEAGLSPSHFCREFKRTTGKTPFQYLLDVRCNEAMKRLEHGTDPVLMIALDCGFKSSQSFCRAFKRVIGCSPTEYRRLGYSTRDLIRQVGA